VIHDPAATQDLVTGVKYAGLTGGNRALGLGKTNAGRRGIVRCIWIVQGNDLGRLRFG
jgi:hypothetical protein